MGALEPPHLILILVIVLIIFGPGKLPQLGKALGDGIRELKHATNPDEAPPPAQDVARCAHCQSPVNPGDRFCGTCGSAYAPPSAVAAPRTPDAARTPDRIETRLR